MMKVSRGGCRGRRGLEVFSTGGGAHSWSQADIWSSRDPVSRYTKDGYYILRSLLTLLQRQTVISQFYQMDKLVVEGQETVSF